MHSDGVPPTILEGFVARNAPSSVSNSPTDSWRRFLESQLGHGGNLYQLECEWLKSVGGTGTQLTNLWESYLNSIGINTGHPDSDLYTFFATSTITGGVAGPSGTAIGLLLGLTYP